MPKYFDVSFIHGPSKLGHNFKNSLIFEFFKYFFCQFWLWMINVIIIFDAQMVSLKISPNLTKNWNLSKISRLISESLGRPIKSHIVQNIYHMFVFTRPTELLIVWPNIKVSRFVGNAQINWNNPSIWRSIKNDCSWHFLPTPSSLKGHITIPKEPLYSEWWLCQPYNLRTQEVFWLLFCLVEK